jgi:hypothetical protein
MSRTRKKRRRMPRRLRPLRTPRKLLYDPVSVLRRQKARRGREEQKKRGCMLIGLDSVSGVRAISARLDDWAPSVVLEMCRTRFRRLHGRFPRVGERVSLAFLGSYARGAYAICGRGAWTFELPRRKSDPQAWLRDVRAERSRDLWLALRPRSDLRLWLLKRGKK